MLHVRQTMEPMRRYTTALLGQGSIHDNQRAEATEIKHMNETSAGMPDNGEARRFPIQSAAHLELEYEFLSDMHKLLTQPELWDDLLYDESKTLETNCLIFKLWSIFT